MKRKTTNLMFSKKSDDHSTPPDFYAELHREFKFTDDPCPLRGKVNGLTRAWGARAFVNPPYSNIRGFMDKAVQEIQHNRCKLAVFLVPARTDTKWFHDVVLTNHAEVRFIRGRLKFGESKNSAPFPSILCIFRGA